MPSISLEEVEKALYLPLGSAVVRYNRCLDTFTLINMFFKALGQVGAQALLVKIKQRLPGAEILNTWTNKESAESHCGYECVEFRISKDAT